MAGLRTHSSRRQARPPAGPTTRSPRPPRLARSRPMQRSKSSVPRSSIHLLPVLPHSPTPSLDHFGIPPSLRQQSSPTPNRPRPRPQEKPQLHIESNAVRSPRPESGPVAHKTPSRLSLPRPRWTTRSRRFRPRPPPLPRGGRFPRSIAGASALSLRESLRRARRVRRARV